MKVALVHDYIKEYGGAERVLEALHEIWPDTEVFTSVYLPEYLGPHKERFKNWKINTSFFQSFLFKDKLISIIRIFGSLIFESWDFSDFDLVIVSQTGAYIPNIINKKKAIHICYCHTPPRYLYGYPTARDWKKNIAGRVLGEFLNHFLRITDYKASQNPDFFVANSFEVRNRIRKFYRREATVIYPPVDINPKSKDTNQIQNSKFKHLETYYLAGGRLARAKHIDLIIRVANKLKIKLKIFGKGFAGYDRELKESAGATIEFLGEVPDRELTSLYGNSKALIFASELEDFGIVPVEAQVQGTPVIAFRSGGVKETIIEGKTGLFFDTLSVDSLSGAIKRFEKLKIKKEDCRENAKKFSKQRFKREIINFVRDNARIT